MCADRPKQYLPLAGKTVLEVTLERLSSVSDLSGVLVGIGEDDRWWPEISVSVTGVREVFPGGAERSQTVLNGLRALSRFAAPDDLVLVHDAVRPCVRVSDILRLIESAGHCADGGMLALPIPSTIKRSDANNRVIETVSRERLWRALTPQLFTIKRLTDALSAAVARGQAVTDEASAIEQAGGRPLLVEGAADNIKITVPADLALAELILQSQASGGT
jgi:2-C-methyl-D-erythritol 4-phosphate cytidylyltransferase